MSDFVGKIKKAGQKNNRHKLLRRLDRHGENDLGQAQTVRDFHG